MWNGPGLEPCRRIFQRTGVFLTNARSKRHLLCHLLQWVVRSTCANQFGPWPCRRLGQCYWQGGELLLWLELELRCSMLKHKLKLLRTISNFALAQSSQWSLGIAGLTSSTTSDFGFELNMMPPHPAKHLQ